MTLRAHGGGDDAPPGCDARDRPGGRVHVVEMGGRADDLRAPDDDVCGECADGRVIPSSKEPEPSSVVPPFVERGSAMSSYGGAYGPSGASGSLSHPRVGTRKTRLFSSSSSSSCAATTIPGRDACWTRIGYGITGWGPLWRSTVLTRPICAQGASCYDSRVLTFPNPELQRRKSRIYYDAHQRCPTRR